MLVEGSFTSILDPDTVTCDGGRAALLDTPFLELKTQTQRLEYCQLLIAFAEFVYTHPSVRSTQRVYFRTLEPANKQICNSIWFPVLECFEATAGKEVTEIARQVGDLGLSPVSNSSSEFKDKERLQQQQQEQQQVFVGLVQRLRVLIGICTYINETVLDARWSQDKTSPEVVAYVNEERSNFEDLHAALRWLGLWCVLRSGELHGLPCRRSLLFVCCAFCRCDDV